jgi:hypothetical protein
MIDPCPLPVHHWWQSHPPVGTFIGILGGLGVIVPWLFRPLEKMGRREKAIWTSLMLLFVWLEIRTLYLDRDEHDAEQTHELCVQRKSFENIADGISTAISTSQTQFGVTMAQIGKTIAGVEDSIKTQTGGDSFAFISFTAEPLQPFQMHWNNLVAPKNTPYFLVTVTSHGKYPLREVHGTLIDDDRRLIAMRQYNEHPDGDWMKAINSGDTEYRMQYLRPQSSEAPSGEADVIGIYPMPDSDSKRVTVSFSAPNGYWNEVLHLGRVNGKWHECLSVLGPKRSVRPFVWCDSEWAEGRRLATNDWGKLHQP